MARALGAIAVGSAVGLVIALALHGTITEAAAALLAVAVVQFEALHLEQRDRRKEREDVRAAIGQRVSGSLALLKRFRTVFRERASSRVWKGEPSLSAFSRAESLELRIFDGHLANLPQPLSKQIVEFHAAETHLCELLAKMETPGFAGLAPERKIEWLWVVEAQIEKGHELRRCSLAFACVWRRLGKEL